MNCSRAPWALVVIIVLATGARKADAALNVINTGTTLQVSSDLTGGLEEFLGLGGVTLNGGTILSNDPSLLGIPLGTFSTVRVFSVNTVGGTLAATTGTTATYNGAIVNGNGTTGVLTLGTALNKGAIVFTADNTFTGGALIDGITLKLAGDGTPGAGPLDLTAGATLDLDGSVQTVGVVTLDTGTLATSGGPATLNTAGVIVNGTGNTINNGVTEVGGIVQNANSTLTVNGTAGADSLSSSATLNGLGTVGAVTLSNNDTVTSTGTLHTAGITVNGTGNILSGTETATAGLTVNTGGSVTQTGVLTGSLIDTGNAVINGSLSGNATVGAGGMLGGSGTVGGTTSVTSGIVNGTGLRLTGLTTFNGTGNVLGGTETGNVALAGSAAVTQSGTLTGNVSLANGAGTLFSGTGTVGAVTLNGSGDTVSSGGTLTTTGLTVNGTNNNIGTGTIVGNAVLNSGASLTDNGRLNGTATVGNGTLGGSGSVTGTTSVTGGTINGAGLGLNGLITFNGMGNILSGMETGNVALSTGAAVTQSGTLTGNVNLASGANTIFNGTGTVGNVTLNGGGDTLGSAGTLTTTGVTVNGLNNIIGSGTVAGNVTLSSGAALTDNGTLSGPVTVGNGTLGGTGTVSGAAGVTGGTINGAGLNLSGSATFNGTGNTLSGTESGAVNLAAGANLSQSGTLTGNVNLAAGSTAMVGGGTVGTVTLNGGGNTLSSGTTLTTGGIAVNGTGNTLVSGTIVGDTVLNNGAGLTDNATLNGSINVGGGTLGGTGSVSGTVTLGSGGAVNLENGSIGTLTTGGIVTGSASVASSLFFDIGSTLGSNDKILDSGTLTLNASGGTTINIGNATGTTSLADGTYTLVSAAGVTGNLANINLGTTTLDGKVLSISLDGDLLDLTVGTSNVTVGTNYTVVTTAGADRIMSGQSTTLLTTITNTGSGPADALDYTGLGAGVSGSTTNGGPLANGGASGSNTGQTFTGTTTGAQTISPTVGSATNDSLGTAVMGTATGTTIDVLANRTESATAVDLGRVMVGQTTNSQNTTISSITGQDDSLTRITLGAGSQAATGVTNGTVTLGSGAAYQFGGANDATNSTTRSVTGSFTTAGVQSGTAVITPAGEGLTGEAVNPIDISYTADAVNKRTVTDGAATDLGTLHASSVVNVTSSDFTTTGSNATTTSVQVAAGTGVADSHGVALSGAATTFDGSTTSDSRTFGGTISGSGAISGIFDLGVTTLENGGAGLTGEGTYGSVAVGYTATVYSGHGVYVGTGGGSYGTIAAHPNFSVAGGAPGLDSNFTTTDTATFGNSIGATSATVTLDGDNPSLNAITFDNTLGGSYTLAQGTSGMFKLNAGTGGTARINNTAGNDTISAPIELDSAAAIAVANGDTLILSGPLSESGGPQSLAVNGPGTTVFSGANTYSGGTTLSSGTLDITGSGTLGASTGSLTVQGGILDLGGTSQTVGAVDITGASTLQNGTLNGASFTDSATSGTVDITANLAGAGGLDKSGAGVLALNGTNSYHGDTAISGGTVLVGNLSAFGTGNVSMSNGTLETGNGVHQINVAGNYTQSGGTLVLNVTGHMPGVDPGYEFLNVTGTANLGGALMVDVSAPYIPANGDRFTFVQAGAITGGFTSVQTNLFSLSITQQGAGIIILQLPFATLPGVPYTPNESSIAQSIDAGLLANNLNPDFATLVAALNRQAGGSPAALAAAMSELSPEKFASFSSTSRFNQAVFDSEALNQYLDSRRGRNGNFISNGTQIDTSGLTVSDPSMDPGLNMVHSQLLAWSPASRAPGLLSDSSDSILAGIRMEDPNSLTPSAEPVNKAHFFIDGSVVAAQGFSQSDVPHFDSTTGSIGLGGDYQFGPHFLVGALFNYSHTDATLDNEGSTAYVDSYSPGIYASFADKGWYANGLASYSHNDYAENRQIAFLGSQAKGSPSGDQVSASLTGGYDFHAGNWTFGPTLGVQYTHLQMDRFTETGSVGDLTVNGDDADSLRSLLGAHISYEVASHGIIFHPHLSASWQHEFMDQSRGINASLNAVGGGSFIVQTTQPSLDSALIDLGLNVDLNRTATIFADYMTQVGQDDYFAQFLQGGVRIGF